MLKGEARERDLFDTLMIFLKVFKSFRNIIRVSNSLDTGQSGRSGSIQTAWERVLADGEIVTSKLRVNCQTRVSKSLDTDQTSYKFRT